MRQWLIPVVSTALTVVVFLAAVPHLAPDLRRVPVDLQVVQVDDVVPPFFDNVFREVDPHAGSFLVADPYSVRGRQLLPDLRYRRGPNDLLGFRNRSIPNVADIITIGDSQTYGNNARLEHNWPAVMRGQLGELDPLLYDMSVGGWGPVEYLQALRCALEFRPRVIVVAFYTGNDAWNGFRTAYSRPRWQHLQPDPQLTSADSPDMYAHPDWGPVTFADGVTTTFTPGKRLTSNDEQRSTRAGYAILDQVAREMVALTTQAGVALIFTVIPTKELAYGDKVVAQLDDVPAVYHELLRAEGAHLQRLARTLGELEGARYVDLLLPLRQAAGSAQTLYPEGNDGHPLEAGYRVIGEALAPSLREHLRPRPVGLARWRDEHDRLRTALVKADGFHYFESSERARSNGWETDAAPTLTLRDVAGLPYLGKIRTDEPALYGPTAVATRSAVSVAGR